MRPHEITLTPINGRWFVFFVTHLLPFIEEAGHADGAGAFRCGIWRTLRLADRVLVGAAPVSLRFAGNSIDVPIDASIRNILSLCIYRQSMYQGVA